MAEPTDLPTDADPSPKGRAPDPSSVPTKMFASMRARPDPLIGRKVAGFTIKSLIASGGMGSVYVAVQETPRRKVALKLMKAGIASRSALRRFEFESQTLARLNHPNIAQVHDAGTHDDGSGGVPYFAMEYITGAKALTEYASAKRLGTSERLALFARVCDAVHHGHQKGIIHRDLKPSNILVDSSGQPKIIDFGVARATDSDMAVTTLQTDIGQLIGTLQYMSPEQCDADPDDLDTRSDVYALGVVLYELLCGRPPYDLARAAVHEAVRVIREEAPAKPSTVDRTLRGDVETITLKALEKDRDRRYDSAADLAQDIGRYLRSEPIEARAPSVVYRIRKFARRNKAAFVVLTTLLVAIPVLGAATVVSVAARRDAEKAEHKARQIADFTQEMLSAIDPEIAGDLDKTLMRTVLENAAARIGTDLAGQPEVEASIRGTIGRSYMAIGEYTAAEPHLERSRDLRRDVLGAEHPDTLNSMSSLANLYNAQGRYDEAEPVYLKTLETRRRVQGSEHPHTLISMNNLANLYRDEGRYDEAEPLLLETLETRRRALGAEHPHTLASMNNHALLYERQGRYDEAEPVYLKTLETRRRVLGAEHPDTLGSMTNLALLYQSQGRYDEAEPLHIETLETRRRVLGDEHPHTLRSMNNLASLYRRQGRSDEAEPLHIETLETRRRVLGVEHPETLRSMNNLANLYMRQGRNDEAEPLLLETLETRRRVLGAEHPETLRSMNNLANLYASQGRHDEAEPLHLEALETRRRALGAEHPDTLASMNNLANLYRREGRYDEAEPLYLETLETFRRVLGSEHPNTLNSMNGLAILYKTQGRYDEAEPFYLETLETRRRVLGAEHPDTLWSMNNLANLYRRQGRSDEAEPLHLETLETRRRVLGAEHPDTLASMNNLANLYRGEGRYDEAKPLYLETLETFRRILGSEHPNTLNSMNGLAILYLRQGRYDAAEPLYVETFETYRRVRGAEHPQTLSSMNDLARLYTAQGRYEAARPYVQPLIAYGLREAQKDGASPGAKNGCARTLLTCEPADLRDPETALTLALAANDMTGHENPRYLDTLALAYHMTGDTEKAIENQKKAVALLPPGESDRRTRMEAALAKFEAALAEQTETAPAP